MKDVSLFTPFRGERYADAASLERRLAPPYDVISPSQRAELVARDPCNVVNVDLPAAPGGGDPYAEAARLLAEWRASGVLVRDEQPSAYVLRTSGRFPDGSVRERTGVFLAVAAEPFSRGRVLPHERTHAAAKEDRRRLMHATGANLSAVFLLAPDGTGKLDGALRQATARPPWARCPALGSDQAIWVVTGAEAEQLAAAAGAESVYVADGHHRFETSVMFRDEAPSAWQAGAARTLAYVVSFRDPGLVILATHRMLEGAPFEPDAFLAAAAPYFAIAPTRKEPTLSVVFKGGREVALAVRPKAKWPKVNDQAVHPAVRALEVAAADSLAVGVVAASLLGTAPALRYTADVAEAREAGREGRCACALILPPTRLEAVRRVADAGQIMPPKSTFFAPKVPTGVVLRPFDAPV
ncbi:MAG TPA: DUF1015 domain-containing protein [Gemmatimonadales bacterium]|nr:DUF1015 domain-containing protein [Gemmatimonadales bacterium]